MQIKIHSTINILLDSEQNDMQIRVLSTQNQQHNNDMSKSMHSTSTMRHPSSILG